MVEPHGQWSGSGLECLLGHLTLSYYGKGPLQLEGLLTFPGDLFLHDSMFSHLRYQAQTTSGSIVLTQRMVELPEWTDL